MPKLGDSRAMEGPGLVPGQDHRLTIDVEKRAALIAVRIIDIVDGPVRYHVDDETLRGDVQGLSVWALDDRTTSPRPCAMWRHAWPSVVMPYGDAFIEEEIPPDSFPSFSGVETPGSGSGGSGYGGSPNNGWGSLTRDPRDIVRLGGIRIL